MFKKILIANRGEIAVRVLRACRELGVPSVAVYSEADRGSLHVRLADEAVCIGPAPALESYLNQDAILAAAEYAGADAVHPGYGFLSENEDFAAACASAGVRFIGPSPDAILKLGNKVEARRIAKKAGVPLVPGTEGPVSGDFKKEASRIGYPLMIKAAAGGGGKGLRRVHNEAELEREARMAQSEARAAFGDDSIYLERYVQNPRHVEIQVAADVQGDAVALPERDCTVQRRHQKLIEESPSPAVTPQIRKRMAEAALALVKASGYVNVGTVEFLLDPDGRFYFIEVNTRLQVEHPVTEFVTGIDLVQLQIRLAEGLDLPFTQARAQELRGHAIEHRLNAENPDRGFAPSPGTIKVWQPPSGPGVRVDSHLYAGYTVPSYYDSLLAKLICYAEDRPRVLARARRALRELDIQGVDTTAGFHLKVLEHPDFIEGRVDTGFADLLLAKEAAAGGSK